MDKKLLISNNWNISSPGKPLKFVSRTFFYKWSLKHFSYLSQVSSRADCKGNYRPQEKGVEKSRQEGNCFHAVYALETGLASYDRVFTGVTWSQGNDTLKGLKRGSWKFQQCFRAVEGVGAKFISRPHRLGPRCYGLCSSDRGVGRGWSTRAPWKRGETRNRGGVVGRGRGGKNAGAKKVRKRKRSTNGRGRNIEGRLLRFAAELRSIMMFPIQICCCFYL